MKPLSLIFLLVFICARDSFSQDTKARDSILVTGSAMGGMRFFQHGENLRLGQLKEILKPNPEAFGYFQKAKMNNVFALVCSAVGGFAIGWELGTSLGAKSINWGIMGGGIAVAGFSFAFAFGAKRNLSKAVRIYNASL
jgi:hypothetical protein